MDCDAISRLVAALTPEREESIEHPERWNEQRISDLLEPEPSECLHSDLQTVSRQKLEQTSKEIMDRRKSPFQAENCAALPKVSQANDHVQAHTRAVSR